MATKHSGESGVPVLISGSAANQLNLASAFGSSMKPFIRSGAELVLEHVSPARIRPGDIIAYAALSGASVTHRVVKVFIKEKTLLFLTKGDNKSIPDPIVHQKQILGRVVKIDQTDIRTLFWRLVGQAAAWVSYGHYQVVEVLAKSPANRLRHRLERRGVIPKVKLRVLSDRTANLFSWGNRLSSCFDNLKLRWYKHTLALSGIRVSYSHAPSDEFMVAVWNEAFPGYETNCERFGRLVGPRSFFLVRQRTNLIAWAAVRTEEAIGSIDVIALGRKGWRIGGGRLLFYEMIRWFGKENVRQIFLNPHPVPMHPIGVPVTPLLATASEFGFEPIEISTEWSVTDGSYRVPLCQALPESIMIRDIVETDASALRTFFDKNGRSMEKYLSRAHDFSSERGGRILAVFLDGLIVGFSRLMPDERLESCEEITWAWALSKPSQKRGYFVRLLIDRAHQGRGIGTVLADRSFQALFKDGCREIRLVALKNETTDGFYKRFGFVEKGRFVRLKRRAVR